jgi:hypothetical protein
MALNHQIGYNASNNNTKPRLRFVQGTKFHKISGNRKVDLWTVEI